MSTFKRGDRVAMYGCDQLGAFKWGTTMDTNGRQTGTVEYVGPFYVNVRIDNSDGWETWHPKQLRKLKAKEKRNIWIKTDGGLSATNSHLDQQVAFDWAKKLIKEPGWVEFREVTKKKTEVG